MKRAVINNGIGLDVQKLYGGDVTRLFGHDDSAYHAECIVESDLDDIIDLLELLFLRIELGRISRRVLVELDTEVTGTVQPASCNTTQDDRCNLPENLVALNIYLLFGLSGDETDLVTTQYKGIVVWSGVLPPQAVRLLKIHHSARLHLLAKQFHTFGLYEVTLHTAHGLCGTINFLHYPLLLTGRQRGLSHDMGGDKKIQHEYEVQGTRYEV